MNRRTASEHLTEQNPVSRIGDGTRRAGVLRLHDIYNLNLPAELVVLSACNTAIGKDIKGEGLIG
jgi:CHAT domain-containing protein